MPHALTNLVLAAALVAAQGCTRAPSSETGSSSAASSGAGTTTSSGASSGAGTTMASGASSSSSSSGGSSFWLELPGLWAAAGGTLEQTCDVWQAKLPAGGIPRRTWTACGPGCLEAPTALPGSGQERVVIGGLSAHEVDGEIYYHISSNPGDDGAYGLSEVSRLSDDAPVILLRRSRDCLAFSGRRSPMLFGIVKSQANGDPGPAPRVSIGKGQYTPASDVVFADPGFELQSGSVVLFELDHGFGAIRDLVSVQIAQTPGSGALSEVFYSDSVQRGPLHRDDLVAWCDYTGVAPPAKRAGLRIWSPLGGTKILVPGVQGDVADSAITSTRIVWIEATGFASVEGKFESAQVFYSPRTTDPAGIQRNPGPVLPHTETANNGFAAYGDRVALVTTTPSNAGIVVADVMTSKVWVIPHRPGKLFREVMAMNASSLLVMEYDLGHSSQLMDHLVRLDLAKLDELVKGWP